MVLCLLIVGVTILFIIGSILFYPTIKIRSIRVGSYWLIALIGALLLIATQQISFAHVLDVFTSNSSMNPLKILVLFISMTLLSIYLDEIGFFHYIAVRSTKRFKQSQIKLFFGLYALISILTVFTSNDIIILTFTPFLCYYAKQAKINPIPYLIMEFVAANTWSMFLIIGNPTNIYLASAFELGFFEYLKGMALPTIFASITSLSILFLIFRKKLKTPISMFETTETMLSKPLLCIGLTHLLLATITLAIASYLSLEMWIIALVFATSLFLCTFIYTKIAKEHRRLLHKTALRAPWNLVPFVLSMFVLVLALDEQGFIPLVEDFLSGLHPVYAYGLFGALTANLINNIPMSVLFSSILTNAPLSSIYATILSSNIAAFITPIGALAGIMWMSLLKTYNIKLSFVKFSLYGCIIGIPTLLIALSTLLF